LNYLPVFALNAGQRCWTSEPNLR